MVCQCIWKPRLNPYSDSMSSTSNDSRYTQPLQNPLSTQYQQQPNYLNGGGKNRYTLTHYKLTCNNSKSVTEFRQLELWFWIKCNKLGVFCTVKHVEYNPIPGSHNHRHKLLEITYKLNRHLVEW